MATPNYGYEKRQRELAKKKKKEDKLKAKAAAKRHDEDGTLEQPSSDTENDGPSAGPDDQSER